MTIAYFRYTKEYPAPVGLVFDIDGEPSVQILDVNDCVVSFESVPKDHVDRLVNFDRPEILAEIGCRAIQAFEVSSENLLIGTAEELVGQYKEYLAFSNMEEYPFTAFELAQIVNDAELEEKSAIRCVRHLFYMSEFIANSWIRTTGMSTNAKNAAIATLAFLKQETVERINVPRDAILKSIFASIVNDYRIEEDNDVLLNIEASVEYSVENAEIRAEANSELSYEFDGGYAVLTSILFPEFEDKVPDITVIVSDAKKVVFVLKVSVGCEVYGNFSFSILDFVDKDYVKLGDLEFHREHQFDTEVQVTLVGDFDIRADEVSVEKVKVVDKVIFVDFGYVTFSHMQG